MQPLAKAPMMQNSFEVEADQTFPQIDFTNLGLDDEGKPIEFPDLPYYGFDHGDKTAKLATVILSHQGPQHSKPEHLRAVWVAGYFHDLGRTQPWTKPDPYHAARSASLLERVLKATDLWADGLLRDTACRLVANHSTRPETNDPLARALWDADCFEAARFEPGQREGLVKLKERTAKDVLCTDWARNHQRLKTYMEFRGW